MHISLQRRAWICSHLAHGMTKPSSEGMASGAYGQTSASLGGSFSHNAPINVCSLATVTAQFVHAIINSGNIVLPWKEGNSGEASWKVQFNAAKKVLKRDQEAQDKALFSHPCVFSSLHSLTFRLK